MGKRLALNDFLTKARKIHPEYDYSLVTEYKNNVTKVPVICHEKDITGKEHGIFMITPANLLSGRGCPKCEGKCFTSEERIKLCSIKYNGRYDYSKTDFSRVKDKTIVICPEHGEFITTFDNHFNKNCGCKKCVRNVWDTSSFKEEANKVHNECYLYDKTIYTNSHTKVIITCPVHGDFQQIPNAHLRGEGCPSCAKKSILEERIENALNENSISYIKDKRTKWLITEKRGQSHLDFFIPELNLAIECQGKQHFGVGGWTSEFDFKERYEIDKWKNEQCKKRNIEIIYLANENYITKKYINNYLGKIFFDIDELLRYIKYLLLNKKDNT